MAEQGYAITHEGRTFTPEGKADLAPATVEAHNRELEAHELANWEGKPDRALGYYSFPASPSGGQYRAEFRPLIAGATVSTWPGTVIGRITDARVYRHNFGQRFVAIRVLGTNGAEYWGRASWDGGNAIILRKVRAVR